MKKFFYPLMALSLMLVLMLTGCGSSGSQPQPEKKAEEAAPVQESAPASDVKPAEPEAPAIPEYDGYKLLWNDEFDGDTLDETSWNYEPHEPGWTNNELQEYTTSTDNVFLRDGKLVIKAIKTEKDGHVHYTSGKVTNQGKHDFMYGKVVVSAKVPEGKGLWPAIWMMPKYEKYYGQWPRCGEIDLMEVLGDDTRTSYSTIHYGAPHSEQQGTIVLDNGSFSESFHEYSVEWEPGEMRFYTDGTEVLKVNDWFTAVEGADEKPYPAPFNQPFFVQMNLAVGGNWPGDPDENTDFDKAEFEIDYVRIYRKPKYDTNVTKPEKPFREALPDGNYIFNGDFSEVEDLTDDVNWKFLLFNSGEGAAEIRDNMIVITSENDGTEEYSVQLVQPDLPMMKGRKYRVTFDIKADKERDAVVCISAPTSGWIRYLQDTTIDVPTEWKTYTFDIEMTSKSDNNGRLEFNMGHHGYTDTIYITNVRVEEIG